MVVAHPAVAEATASLSWHIYASEGIVTLRIVYAREDRARTRALDLAQVGMTVSVWHDGKLIEHYRQ